MTNPRSRRAAAYATLFACAVAVGVRWAVGPLFPVGRDVFLTVTMLLLALLVGLAKTTTA